MLNKTFKNKKVLITGHTGFKGTWLSLICNNLGAEVIGISKDNINNKSFHTQLKELINSIIILTLEIIKN